MPQKHPFKAVIIVADWQDRIACFVVCRCLLHMIGGNRRETTTTTTTTTPTPIFLNYPTITQRTTDGMTMTRRIAVAGRQHNLLIQVKNRSQGKIQNVVAQHFPVDWRQRGAVLGCRSHGAHVVLPCWCFKKNMSRLLFTRV